MGIFDKANEALHSDKAEEISDRALDGASDFAKKVSGGRFDEKIDGVRNSLDERVGSGAEHPAADAQNGDVTQDATQAAPAGEPGEAADPEQ